jgi:hypothetical protein
MLDALFAPGVLHDNAPHGLGRGGEKVPPVAPRLDFVHIHKTKIRLVDERGGLDRLPGRLVSKSLGRQLPQLLVDQRQ